MYYVYILATRDIERDLYIGYTHDLERRMEEHKENQSGYTQDWKWHLAYYEAYKDEEDARKREKQLKRDGRSKHWLKRRIENSLDDITK